MIKMILGRKLHRMWRKFVVSIIEFKRRRIIKRLSILIV